MVYSIKYHSINYCYNLYNVLFHIESLRHTTNTQTSNGFSKYMYPIVPIIAYLLVMF